MFFLKFFDKVYIFIFSLLPFRINLYISKIFKKLHNLSLEASYRHDFLANLNILNVKFKLWLAGNDSQAQTVYKKLHNTKQVYEIVMVCLLKNLIDNYKIKSVLDLGSFMGYFACFLGRYSSDINIYAVESNSLYCKFIKKTVKENQLNNIKVLNSILSDNSKEMYFHKEGVYATNNNSQMKKKISVTLDYLCEENKIYPELAKIDVHGAEGLVLEGSKKVLKENLKFILLELHTNKYLYQFSNKTNRFKVVSSILQQDFECYLISDLRSSDYNKELNYENIKNKINFLKLDTDNLKTVLFDRDGEDILILASKKGIDLKKLEFFKKTFS